MKRRNMTGDIVFKSKSDNPSKWLSLTEGWKKKRRLYDGPVASEAGIDYFHKQVEEDFFEIVAAHGERVVGVLFYGPWNAEPGHPHLEGAVEVDPQYRRRGIGSRMYQVAETMSERTFLPASSHTPLAEAMWSSPKRSFGSGTDRNRAGAAKRARFSAEQIGNVEYLEAGSIKGADFGLSPREPVLCVNCGHRIEHVYMTDVGPMGGDCLATITGDDSTRKAVQAIRKAAKRISPREMTDLQVRWDPPSGTPRGKSVLSARYRDSGRYRALGVFEGADPRLVRDVAQSVVDEAYGSIGLYVPTVALVV